ncbi:ABC transporter ATP-binding protein [soil metagenome]
MISLQNILLTYPDGDERVTAINNGSLHVEPGTITAITGPSGSGKSSILAVASTLVTPERGRVLIDDIDASALTRKHAARLRRERIGIVFQQSNLLASLTAIEQLELMSHLGSTTGARLSSPQVRAKANELLDAVGLQGKSHKRPHALSGGERQRVNIARALMHDPSVLVVDEPTSALDQERGAAIVELIIGLTRSRRTATLLVTHDRTHLPLMDAALTMVDGVLTPAAESPRSW